MEGLIRVLVVDDSAYMRKVVREMLARSPFIEVVGIAHDGQDALEQIARLEPDVITTDLVMPIMDGVALIRAQMARRPLPIIVVSTLDERSDLGIAALSAGAIDLIQKPTTLASEKMFTIGDKVVASVKHAASSHLLALIEPAPTAPLALPRPWRAGSVELIVIGTSTGGPQALKHIIPRLPADYPIPIAVVLHMPIGYTGPYAQTLDTLAHLPVVEAQAGQNLAPGVWIAPAGRHMSLRRDAGKSAMIHLDANPTDTPHCPAVDVLFQSAAEVFREHTLGVVMTGMGSDGQLGAAWIKAQGGVIWTEAEETCVIYGMPRSVVEAGLSDRTVPLHTLASALLEVV